MSTVEQLAKSILLDGQGVHVLLWDDQDDLVRALIVLLAALKDLPLQPLLLSSAKESASSLRSLFDLQPLPEENRPAEEESVTLPRECFLVLFLQQATSRSIGPWLNGWRSALADKPGTLLIIRRADFPSLQRHAPDLSSFFGPKVYDSSSTLSIWSRETAKRIKHSLPRDVMEILKELPGQAPPRKEIEEWVKQHPPIKTE